MYQYCTRFPTCSQILFVEGSLRGGVSYINQRHCVEQETENEKIEMQYIDGELLKF